MYRCLICILFSILPIISNAQHGSIQVEATDENKELIMGALVEVFQKNVLKGGASTDEKGKCLVQHLLPGTYDVKVSYLGYKSAIIANLVVKQDSITSYNIELEIGWPVNPIRRTYNSVNTIQLPDTAFYCSIRGTITNFEKGIKARIKVYKNDTLLKEAATDRKGNFVINMNDEGIFTVHITAKYRGPSRGQYYYPEYILSDIHLKKGQSAKVNIEMPINKWLSPDENVIITY